MRWQGVDSINLVEDRENWRAVVNTLINFWVSKDT